MKSFRQLVEEKQKSLAILFGRMNPPTKGHEENVNGLKRMAREHNADHLVIASHSHDASKNPLDPATKLKHIKRAFPDTNVTASSKEQPTIMHQAAEAHKKGYTHLIVAGGGDRINEYHHLLNKYNGVEGRHGYYKFDHIEVKSTGERKAGISGSDMRNNVKSGNFKDFKKNLPTNIQKNPVHSTELFHDVTKGMGLHESADRGRNRAIFVTGGPGSGKDVIIRECISDQNVIECNFQQVLDIMNDIHKPAMRSMNPKMESIRNRGPLIINGPADDVEKISRIKEELDRMGYESMMIFVDTTDTTSRERNTLLSRMMVESIRHEKWSKAQKNVDNFTQMFENFIRFDNTDNLEYKVDDISETYTITSQFFDSSVQTTVEFTGNKFLQIYESKGVKVLKDNAPAMQIAAKMGKRDNVKDGDIKMNTGYSKVGGQSYAYTEGSVPTMIKMPEPKETRFSMDADKVMRKKNGDKSLSAARVSTPDGVGSTFDSRATTGAAGAGLGDQSYREQTEYSNDDVVDFAAKPKGVNPNPLAEKSRLKKFKESIFDFGTGDSGVGGTLGGAGNKEPMVTPLEKYGQSGITIKKKKLTGAK
jgi:hypothetical protein